MTFLSFLWAIAFGICPQRPSHSLFIDGQQMPIEARMAGMFGGFLIGIAYFIIIGRGRAWRMPDTPLTVILIGFIALLGMDGLNAMVYDLRLPHLYLPNLYFRLGTGLLTGLALAGFMLPAFNSTVWQTGLDISPLSGLRGLLGGLVAEAVYFVFAFSGWEEALYPLSLVAVLGLPILLGATAAIVLAMISRRLNRARRLADLIPLAVSGLALALLLLGIASGFRYALFGSGPLELSTLIHRP